MIPAVAMAFAASVATPSPDGRIASLVRAVSANDLRAYDTRLVAFGTRNDFSTGVFHARDWIRDRFAGIAASSGGRMSVRLDTYLQAKTARTQRSVVESSVIATLQGDPGGDTYVVSSHFDDCDGNCLDGTGPAPGADDNGSGSAAVIEAAKVMAATRFRGTIVFACFDGEELGLWGSDHFARGLRAQGVRVAADLNNDIIGAPNPASPSERPSVRIFSQALPEGASVETVNLTGAENDSPSRELARFAGEAAGQYVPEIEPALVFRADRFLRGGDQESFTAQGYPAIRFVEAHEDFRHQHQDVRVQDGVQYGDLPEFLDYEYMAGVTRINVAVLASLALGPQTPQDVEMPLRGLTNETTLRWHAAAGAVSYEIVWRETTSPLWQNSENVGDVLQTTLPISKDDFVIGVRSVGADGLRSPVATGLL